MSCKILLFPLRLIFITKLYLAIFAAVYEYQEHPKYLHRR